MKSKRKLKKNMKFGMKKKKSFIVYIFHVKVKLDKFPKFFFSIAQELLDTFRVEDRSDCI
jgi:hypothetical protein